MKLPFEFGTKLIFRLVFPGVILALALYPVAAAGFALVGIDLKAAVIIPVEIVAFGWLVAVSDMHIYMLFEGRRYWPKRLRTWMKKSEEHRLKRLEKVVLSDEEETRESLEMQVEYALFPLNEDGTAYVAHPTRLGNLIESFESYPMVKYGLDAVFSWPRLWTVLDKDLREEVDNFQAVADSTIYVAFALYLGGLFAAAYGLLEHAAARYFLQQTGFSLGYFVPLPTPIALYVIAGACFAGGFLIYRLSLPLHAQFGELFKSVFDQFREKVRFGEVLEDITHIANIKDLQQKTGKEKNLMVFRYLRWHLIRDEVSGKNLTVGEWRRQSANSTQQRTE